MGSRGRVPLVGSDKVRGLFGMRRKGGAWLGKANKRRRPLSILMRSVKICISLGELTPFRRFARLMVSIKPGGVVALYVGFYLI